MVATATRKKDKFQAFYTNCDFITSYMVGLLQCSNNTTVLDPCAGEGAFIDAILNTGILPNIKAFDLSDISITNLREKYKDYPNIQIEKKDFLLLLSLFEETFDRAIANPPYGAYQSPEKRKYLKKVFPNIYPGQTLPPHAAQLL